MINFKLEDRCFNFRSVAVIICNNHLLIHRAIQDDFWALPGGRVEFFETSEQTVVRELKEELDLASSVNRMLWFVENFFPLNNRQYHEISSYFLVDLDKKPNIESEMDFSGIEKEVDLVFRWVPLDCLANYNLYPSFLIRRVLDLPSTLQHLVFNELQTEA